MIIQYLLQLPGWQPRSVIVDGLYRVSLTGYRGDAMLELVPYSLIVGDLEPDMTLTTTVDGAVASLAGALALVMRWKKPDDSVTEVVMIPADTTPLVSADDTVESVSVSLDTLTLTAHGLLTGDGPFRLTTTGTLPAPLALAIDYWVIRIDADTIKLALTLGGSAIDISATGSGTHTLSDTATTARVDLTTGRLKRVWVAGDTDQAGTHRGQLVVTRSNGELQTFPNDGSAFIWNIYERL